jgi:TolA-binding protein
MSKFQYFEPFIKAVTAVQQKTVLNQNITEAVPGEVYLFATAPDSIKKSLRAADASLMLGDIFEKQGNPEDAREVY